MHSRGLELTKLTYTRLEDNLIRHRGDRLEHSQWEYLFWLFPMLGHGMDHRIALKFVAVVSIYPVQVFGPPHAIVKSLTLENVFAVIPLW